MKPKTRLDNFLAKIAKDPEADASMEPKSREEHYLNKIAENGGSGVPFIVTMTPTDTSLQSFILNRTIEEMKDAIQKNTPFILSVNAGSVHLTTSAVSAMYVDNLNAINIDAVINDAAHPGDGYGSSIRVSLYVLSDGGGSQAYAQSSILYKFMGKTEVLTLSVQVRGDDYYAGYGPHDVLNGIDDDGRYGDTAYKLAVIHIDNGIDIPAVANSGYTKITGTFWEGNTVNKIEMAGDGYTPYTVTVTKYNLTPAT